MKRFILVFMLFLPISLLLAQDQWTPEEIIHTKYVSAPLISNNGKHIVWTKRKGIKKEDKFISKVFLTKTDIVREGLPLTVQLTQSNSTEYNVIFDAKQEGIYFLSSREKGNKIWHQSFFGGEPELVFAFKNGISNMQLGADGRLYFVSNEGKSHYELEKEKSKDNTIVVEDEENWKPTRVYALTIASKEVERISKKGESIMSYALSKDGRYLLTRRRMSLHYATDGKDKPEITLYDLKNNTNKIILQEVHLPGNFQFGEELLFFTGSSTSDQRWNGAGKNELYTYDLNSGSVAKVALDWDLGMAYSYYISGNSLIVMLANGPYKKVAQYSMSKGEWKSAIMNLQLNDKQVNVSGISKDGTQLLFDQSSASSLPRYYCGALEKSKKGILALKNKTEWIQLNEGLKKKPVAKYEVIYWKGALGEEVNGILYYPKDYQEGKQYPLILSIHGGPAGVDRDSWSERWSTYPQIYTDKGAFVLKPNYHGSGLHGQAFAESIKKGKYYALDQIDLYNGIQHLNSKGYVDMDKLGLMGWSNGAILTTWMTLKYPDLFKVAAAGAGDVNWTSDYGTCRFGVTFDQYYFGGAPWDDTNGTNHNTWYTENSPIFDIEKIKTPTIIFHGSEDRAVPRDQGWEYFRGLQQVGIAPVRFLWFPGQPHGLRKITHQTRKMKEEIAWIDHYLFGKEKVEPDAVLSSSKLAQALKAKKVEKNNGWIGVLKNGNLLPEMQIIKKDSIGIAVFELTNAQYSAFNKQHKFEAAKGNFPVVDLNKEQVNAYLNWLNTMGEGVYRLPNKTEAKALHSKAKKSGNNENTLAYWAGYTPTLDDARRMKKKIVEEKLFLLQEVGSFSPITLGDAKVYDLVGNAAEYYLQEGKLRFYGFDATSIKDSYASESSDPKYLTIRLILE